MQRFRRSVGLVILSVAVFAAAPASAELEPAPAEVFDKLAPESIEDLKAIEARVEAVAALAAPATVSLNLRPFGTGSGVVIGEEGYILTAAHVIGEADQVIQVQFPDGTTETAITLGSDQQNDAGLAKLQGDGPWPHVEMAPADTLGTGDWVVALGHPGGFELERNVVVRLGRIVRVRQKAIQSDCSLIGGDSGGPLFDMDGRVVGIHSRIGRNERTNIHVPIGEYHTNWNLMAEGRQWGQRMVMPLLGVRFDVDPEDRGVLVTGVLRRSGAAEAGVKLGDIIAKFDDQPVRDEKSIFEALALKVPGDPVTLTILRDQDTIQLEATLGAWE